MKKFNWQIWIGVLIVLVSHLYVLMGGLTAGQLNYHVWSNFAACALIAWGAIKK